MLKAGLFPTKVNMDGWKATRNAWKALFTSVVTICCFLHVFNELPRGKPRSIGAKTTGVARNEAGYIPPPYLDSEYISESLSHYPFCRRY